MLRVVNTRSIDRLMDLDNVYPEPFRRNVRFLISSHSCKNSPTCQFNPARLQGAIEISTKGDGRSLAPCMLSELSFYSEKADSHTPFLKIIWQNLNREGCILPVHNAMSYKENSTMQRGFKRRDVIIATLAAGFAIAVRPISAQTITTSPEGLTAGEIRIPTEDGEIPGYWAKPATGTNLPVVLVVQEIFGVHEYIQDVCRRFAQLGYLAVAPELFIRQGDVSQLSSIDEIRPIVAQVPDAQVMSDLDAALAWAGESGGDVSRAGITGFCWGGRIVWLYAAHSPQLKAGVAWYGRLVGESTTLQPKFPVDIAPYLKAPVLGLYGGADDGIPVSTVEQMRQAIAQGSGNSEIIVYPDAPHAFHADYRPSFRQAAAEDGWQRLQAWFKQNGVA